MSFTVLQELKLGHVLSYQYMADIIPGNAILKSIGADSLYGITIEQREVMLMFQVTTLIIC